MALQCRSTVTWTECAAAVALSRVLERKVREGRLASTVCTCASSSITLSASFIEMHKPNSQIVMEKFQQNI